MKKVKDVTVIGDVHGCFETAKALVKTVLEKHPDTRICFAGDLIDRGPNSRGLVQWVIDNDYDCVQGNHEQMMVDWNGKMSDMLWIGNGGDVTIDSYYDKPKDEDEDGNYIPGKYSKGVFDAKTFREHQLWMNNLPILIEYEYCKNPEGRHLVVSHSICHNYWKAIHGDDTARAEHAYAQVAWNRNFHNIKDQGFFNVIGHTPLDDGPKIKKSYANIDTGCFIGYKGWKSFKKPKNGCLTALHVPSGTTYSQEFIDE
jgi:serine/threonine protein phosphatase 1